MGLTIKSDNSTDELRVDPISKAAHVTLYDSAGAELSPNTVKAGVVIDANNTTTATLGAGAVYNGTGTDILNYNQVNVEVFGRPGVVAGDGSSAKASLYLEFSKDNSNWDVSIPQLIRDPSLIIPIPLINVHKYFRVRYLNDGGVAAIASLGLTDTAGAATAQTEFRLTTYLLPLATKELTRTMDQGISGSDPATLVRGGVMGKNPIGTYTNKNTSGLSLNQNSTVVLGAGASFTGSTWEEILGYQSITVNIDSDLVGTLDIQFSSDGTNITSTVTRPFTNVSAGQNYIFIPIARYARIKYTNTAGTQAFFRLQTIFKSEAVGSIYSPANTALNQNSLAQVVVSIPNDGVKTTYSASVLGHGPVLVPTDTFSIIGSATKTIRILSFFVSGTKTTAAQIDIQLIKRSTASTGGVPTELIRVPHDSNNIGATATVQVYTVNPVPGTSVGTIKVDKLFLPATGTATDGGTKIYEFGKLGQAIVLRGVGESLNLNLNGVTATGGSFNIGVEWTEE